MNVSALTDLITGVGFPIACVLLMAYYIRELTNNHKQEVNELTKNLSTMCLSIQQLTDKIDMLVRKEEGE